MNPERCIACLKLQYTHLIRMLSKFTFPHSKFEATKMSTDFQFPGQLQYKLTTQGYPLHPEFVVMCGVIVLTCFHVSSRGVELDQVICSETKKPAAFYFDSPLLPSHSPLPPPPHLK